MKAEALDIFKIFEKTYGEEPAKKIIPYLENSDSVSIEREVSNKTNTLATKEDLYSTREELVKEIGAVKADIQSAKADMIKWMFIFWMGQIAATFGFIILYLKK